VTSDSDIPYRTRGHGNLGRGVSSGDIDIPASYPPTSGTASAVVLSFVFLVVLLLTAAMKIDIGLLPASLPLMEKSGIGPFMQGLLCGAGYFGLTVSGVPAARILSQHYQRNVLGLACGLNALACVLYGVVEWAPLMVVARVVAGMTQGILAMWAVLWVLDLAPRGKKSTWFMCLQLSIIIGIAGGVGCGVLITTHGEEMIGGIPCWRWPSVVQGLVVLLVGVFIMSINPSLLCTKLNFQKYKGVSMMSTSPMDRQRDSRGIEIRTEDSMNDGPIPPPRELASSAATLSDSFTASFMQTTHDIDNQCESSWLSRDQADWLEEQSNTTWVTAASLLGFPSSLTTVDMSPLGGKAGLLCGCCRRGSREHDRVSFTAHLAALLRNGVFVWCTFALSALMFVCVGLHYSILGHLAERAPLAVATGPVLLLVCVVATVTGFHFGKWLVDRRGGQHGMKQSFEAMKANVALWIIACVSSGFALVVSSVVEMVPCLFLVYFIAAAVSPCLHNILLECMDGEERVFAAAISQYTVGLLGFTLSPLVIGSVASAHSPSTAFAIVCAWSGLALLMMLLALYCCYKNYLQWKQVGLQSALLTDPTSDNDWDIGVI